MIKDGIFTCPFCGENLTVKGKSLFCVNNHCFDVAKSGYVNLLPVDKKNSVNPGDNKEMIAARVRVMNKGYYKTLADKIIEKLGGLNPTRILDAGCGTGYIPYRLKEEFKDTEVVGTDISKYAIEQASKLYKEPAFAVASSKSMPFEKGKADAVICAFAPVYASEFGRVSKEGAIFLRVVPAKEHLYGLKEFLYDAPRYNEEDEMSFCGYEGIGVEKAEGEFVGDKDDIAALVKMTPYYYHTSVEKLEKINSIERLAVNTAFEIRTFRKI